MPSKPGQQGSLKDLCLFNNIIIIDFVTFLLYVCVCMHAMVHVCRSEDNFQKLVLSFYQVDPNDRTQVVRLGGTHSYPLSRLAGLLQTVLIKGINF